MRDISTLYTGTMLMNSGVAWLVLSGMHFFFIALISLFKVFKIEITAETYR